MQSSFAKYFYQLSIQPAACNLNTYYKNNWNGVLLMIMIVISRWWIWSGIFKKILKDRMFVFF